MDSWSRSRRGFVLIISLVIILSIGALAASVVAIHTATQREQTAGRARIQAALAARGAMEMVRGRGASPRTEAGETLFGNGRVLCRTTQSDGKLRVLLDTRFETEGGQHVRRRFEAVLATRDGEMKLVLWRELPAPPEPRT